MVDGARSTLFPLKPHPGAFGSERRHDIHTGIDFYAVEGTPVYAISPGVIHSVIPFTGIAAGCDWWLDTDAIVVEDSNGFWLYGEVGAAAWVEPGATVFAGEAIGQVKRVLRNDKGRPTAMLHVERYELDTPQFAPTWKLGEDKPAGLVDPTKLLLNLLG